MGEIAEDMINGRSCSWCGIYFKKEHGYPVVCEDCYEDATRKQKGKVVKATHKEL